MRKRSFSWLLIALLAFLIGVPIAEDTGSFSESFIRSGAFSVVLAIGVLSLGGSPWLFRFWLLLVCSGIALNIADVRIDSAALTIATNLNFFIYLLLATCNAFYRVAFSTAMDVDRLVGAVCVYMLLGSLWAVSYMLLDLAVPGSFAVISGSEIQISGWLYYSFVTMTTLGYGDILPLTATARALAYFQSIAGQFYIAILVAGLVGAYATRPHK